MEEEMSEANPARKVHRPKEHTAELKVRVKPAELAAWKKKARDASIKLSALVRAALNEIEVRPRREGDHEVLVALARIGNNLNQIARAANQSRGQLQAVELIPHLIDIERYLAELVDERRA